MHNLQQQDIHKMLKHSPHQPVRVISSNAGGYFIICFHVVYCMVCSSNIIALFFAISCLRCLPEFRTALPLHNHYAEKRLAKPVKKASYSNLESSQNVVTTAFAASAAGSSREKNTVNGTAEENGYGAWCDLFFALGHLIDINCRSTHGVAGTGGGIQHKAPEFFHISSLKKFRRLCIFQRVHNKLFLQTIFDLVYLQKIS